MKTTLGIATAAATIALVLAATAAQAAPAAGMLGANQTQSLPIEKVTFGWYKHCHWGYWGYRHCYWGHPYRSGYSYWGPARHWGNYYGRDHHWWGPRYSAHDYRRY